MGVLCKKNLKASLNLIGLTCYCKLIGIRKCVVKGNVNIGEYYRHINTKYTNYCKMYPCVGKASKLTNTDIIFQELLRKLEVIRVFIENLSHIYYVW
jgi:hypothetical protein